MTGKTGSCRIFCLPPMRSAIISTWWSEPRFFRTRRNRMTGNHRRSGEPSRPFHPGTLPRLALPQHARHAQHHRSRLRRGGLGTGLAHHGQRSPCSHHHARKSFCSARVAPALPHEGGPDEHGLSRRKHSATSYLCFIRVNPWLESSLWRLGSRHSLINLRGSAPRRIIRLVLRG